MKYCFGRNICTVILIPIFVLMISSIAHSGLITGWGPPGFSQGYVNVLQQVTFVFSYWHQTSDGAAYCTECDNGIAGSYQGHENHVYEIRCYDDDWPSSDDEFNMNSNEGTFCAPIGDTESVNHSTMVWLNEQTDPITSPDLEFYNTVKVWKLVFSNGYCSVGDLMDEKTEDDYTDMNSGYTIIAPVKITSANTISDQRFRIIWENESKNVYFNVFKSNKDDSLFIKINKRAVNPIENDTFEFVDNNYSDTNTATQYIIEGVDNEGNYEKFGPILPFVNRESINSRDDIYQNFFIRDIDYNGIEILELKKLALEFCKSLHSMDFEI